MPPARTEVPAWRQLDARQWRLLAFLSVATFFEGYDLMALTQILPELRAEFGLDPAAAGLLVGVVNLGTMLAYFLVRKADRWGRRRVLMLTIVGYTLFSLASGLADTATSFAIAQLCARCFLIAEWAISTVYAAEEFPAELRGTALGIIQAFSCLGAVACAAVVPLLLESTYGWRTVYFVGAVPLLIVAFARRNLPETRRFAALAPQLTGPAPPLWHIFRTPYVKPLLLLSATWALTYTCTQNAITFWKEFAVAERGLSNAQVGLAVSLAALLSLPPVFLVGQLLDRIGRRRGAVVIYAVGLFGVLGAYSLHSLWALTLALALGIFGASSVIPVLNAFTTELFPTHLRGDAYAWANNLLGRVGYVGAPVLIGLLVPLLGWSVSIKLTVVLPLIALAIVWRCFPETGRRELEQTASMALAVSQREPPATAPSRLPAAGAAAD